MVVGMFAPGVQLFQGAFAMSAQERAEGELRGEALCHFTQGRHRFVEMLQPAAGDDFGEWPDQKTTQSAWVGFIRRERS